MRRIEIKYIHRCVLGNILTILSWEKSVALKLVELVIGMDYFFVKVVEKKQVLLSIIKRWIVKMKWKKTIFNNYLKLFAVYISHHILRTLKT